MRVRFNQLILRNLVLVFAMLPLCWSAAWGGKYQHSDGVWTERPDPNFEGVGDRFIRSWYYKSETDFINKNGCLSIGSNVRQLGTPVLVQVCNGTDAQLFRFQNGKLMSGEWCLKGDSKGVTLAACSSSGDQTWWLQSGAILHNKNGCLDLDLWTNINSVAVNSTCDDRYNHHWVMMPANKESKIVFSKATFKYAEGPADAVYAFISLENRPPDKDSLRLLKKGWITDYRAEPGAAQQAFVIVPDGSNKFFDWSFRNMVYSLPQGRIYYMAATCRLGEGGSLTLGYSKDLSDYSLTVMNEPSGNLQGFDRTVALTAATDEANKGLCYGFDSGARVAFDAPPDFPYSGRKECVAGNTNLARNKRACQSSLYWEPPAHDYWRSVSHFDPDPFRYCDAGGSSWRYNEGRVSPGGAVDEELDNKRGTEDHDFGFHTASGPNQWWFVDLGGVAVIKSIKVKKRESCCLAQSSDWVVDLSDDALDWTNGAVGTRSAVTLTPESKTCIKSDTLKECSIEFAQTESARFVRLRRPGNDLFHLRQVKVMGCAAD